MSSQVFLLTIVSVTFSINTPAKPESSFRTFMGNVKRPERPVIAVDGKTQKGASSMGK